MTRVLISAGDPSGDLYSAALVAELRKRSSQWEFEGLGGRRLEDAGAKLANEPDAAGVMGVTEVLRSLPAHASALRSLRQKLREGRYQLVILVDYPDFNLRLARAASDAGVPVLYYIAPQLWAWRQGRSRRMKQTVTRLAAIFPFEQEFFGSRGIATEWVGHPLMDVSGHHDREATRRKLAVGKGDVLLACFPGSRAQETRRMRPLFEQTASLVRNDLPGLQVRFAGDAEHFGTGSDRDPEMLLAAADVALTKSGTISLQAALAGVPNVIAHVMHPLSHAIAKRLVTIPHAGMTNVLLGRRAVPEFLQDHASPGDVAAALLKLVPHHAESDRQSQLSAFNALKDLLGGPGATARVADIAMEIAA